MRYTARLVWCVLAAVAALCGPAQAQSPAFPTKPIRMIVTAAPGGITDIMTRVMQEQIVRGLGQQMIVENRPGAAGAIAVEYVARSAPDGYTLVIVNVGNAAIVPWIRKDLPYDPMNDLVGVAAVAEAPTIVAVNSRLPVTSLKEFIEYAKTNPGKINYGSAGNASMTHLSAEVLAHLTGISMVHVPYKGAAPASVDLAAGRVQLAMVAYGSVKGQIAAGQVRVLAVAAPARLAVLPEVPTFEQAGVSGYDVTNWFGVLAPRGTPRDVIQTLNSHIGQAFENPQVGQRLADVGILPMKESVEQFQKRIIAEHAKWRHIVRNAGITAQ